MQYFEIEQSNEGRPVLVWHYENNRIYGTPAIAKSLDLDVLLDEEEMEHAEYLIRKHYDEMFVESALGDFMSETKNKIQKLIKNIFNGAFPAVKWLFCHQEILTDKRVTEAIEKYDGKPRIDKLLKLDKESREFVEKTFGIRINSSEEGFQANSPTR